jgi:flagella basal body P-ring formation protein FlgA
MPLVKNALILAAALVSGLGAENIGPLEILPQVHAGSQGVFLTDLITNRTEKVVPRILLAPAPQIGRPLFLSRFQINDLLKLKAPDLVCSNWLGSDRVRVLRSTRVVDEAALRPLLRSALQEEQVKSRGELELAFNRPWNNLLVPDDVLSVKIKEIPSSGVTQNFICRFELVAGNESVGIFQQPLLANIWKEVYVAHSSIGRGELLKDADIGLEKRDLLSLRDYLTQLPLENPYVEFRENVQGGAPILPRELRLRAIVKRGRILDAMLQENSMTISVKAEALEDGVPGQPIRVRNIQSKREFRGKVQDESTVLVLF